MPYTLNTMNSKGLKYSKYQPNQIPTHKNGISIILSIICEKRSQSHSHTLHWFHYAYLVAPPPSYDTCVWPLVVTTFTMRRFICVFVGECGKYSTYTLYGWDCLFVKQMPIKFPFNTKDICDTKQLATSSAEWFASTTILSAFFL